MPTSNSEMYDRGVRDAVNDELNPFYYQHYYYYRKGYDDTRRQLRRQQGRPSPLLVIVIALLVLGAAGALYWWSGRPSGAPVAPLPTSAPPPVPTPGPTPAPTVTPPPTITVEGSPAGLAVGARARVINLGGAPLRARAAPGLSSPVTARIPEGREVTVLEGPIEADGYVWWRVEAAEGAGWVAERSPEGTVFLSP
ncbi:MAG: SH3 domain-containing protein [Chloroflexaceae bacterium]|nr:SH3 domain-containing protein [Chloroflexaceae bacterium]